METASAHAIVAGPKRGAAVDRDLWHGGIGHRLNHLGAVLDDAGFFIRLAHHVAGGVVQIQDRRARLAAGLNKVGGFGGACRVDRPVVGDDADRPAFDLNMAAHRGAAVVFGELQKVRIVGQAGNHLLHVDRAFVVIGHDAQEFFGVVTRGLEGARHLQGHRPVPVQLGHDVAGDAQAVAVVFGQVVAQA